MAIEQIQSVEDSSPVANDPIKNTWHPKWWVDVGGEVMLGVTMDDGCYVVLVERAGSWRPMTHIPVEAAKMLGRLAGE